MSEQAGLGSVHRSVSVMPNPGAAVSLIAEGTLSQSFADNVSGVMSVYDGRRVGLWIKHDGDASQSDGYPVVLVQLSAVREKPAIGDDSWYAPGLAEQSWTAADIAAGVTLVTDADYSKGPVWSPLSIGGLLLQLKPTGTETPRILLPPIDVTLALWMYAAVIQQGDTTNFGTAAIDWSMSL